MPLTLKYSLQDSSLKPSGITGEYARLQVNWRSERSRLTISDDDYREMVEALTEGRLIGLQTESGLYLGQFVTGLAGGVIVEEFIAAKRSDARISFKPMRKFLQDIRAAMTFERIPTITNDPTLNGFTFVETETSTEHVNEIPMDTLGFLKVTGEHFVKNGMTAMINQEAARIALSIVDSGTKHINIVLPNLVAPFTVGPTTLTVKRIDNPERFSVMKFKIIA